MRVFIRKISDRDAERVVLECVELSRDFQDIREFALAKGGSMTGYLEGNESVRLLLRDILYFEAVGETVFAYTKGGVYTVRKRLYEVEQDFRSLRFVRCSKSFVINLLRVESFRPAMNGRFYARMKNGEDVLVSRQYAKEIREALSGEKSP